MKIVCRPSAVKDIKFANPALESTRATRGLIDDFLGGLDGRFTGLGGFDFAQHLRVPRWLDEDLPLWPDLPHCHHVIFVFHKLDWHQLASSVGGHGAASDLTFRSLGVSVSRFSGPRTLAKHRAET
jgi:hypothetical protein